MVIEFKINIWFLLKVSEGSMALYLTVNFSNKKRQSRAGLENQDRVN